ncbi:MAG: 4Fe-4S binding protein [Anaerolineae bacterium]|nr:4Fe-4S binding protein [Anaerolineae bacterium]
MTPSLAQLANAIGALGDPSPELDPERCLNVIHRQAGQCQFCADSCPVAAITLNPVPEFNAGVCLACGACVAACPSAALQGKRSALELWRETRKATVDGTATLVCRAVGGGPYAAVRLPCVGALPPEFLISLVLEGVSHLILHTANCAACPLGRCIAQTRRAIDLAADFLSQLGMALDVTLTTEVPPAAQAAPSALSRRRFFASILQPTGTLSVPDHLDTFLDLGVGWRRALLLDGLTYAAVNPVREAVIPAETGCWGVVEVSSQCIGCQMCAQFCPSGALATTRAEDEVTLWFNPARCTACGLCTRVCFKHAIVLAETVDLAGLVNGQFAPLWRGRPLSNPLSSTANKARRRPVQPAS